MTAHRVSASQLVVNANATLSMLALRSDCWTISRPSSRPCTETRARHPRQLRSAEFIGIRILEKVDEVLSLLVSGKFVAQSHRCAGPGHQRFWWCRAGLLGPGVLKHRDHRLDVERHDTRHDSGTVTNSAGQFWAWERTAARWQPRPSRFGSVVGATDACARGGRRRRGVGSLECHVRVPCPSGDRVPNTGSGNDAGDGLRHPTHPVPRPGSHPAQAR